MTEMYNVEKSRYLNFKCNVENVKIKKFKI